MLGEIVYSKWNIDRQNNKWNINELLRLEREYDLLELNVVEIAKLHQRTATAIAMKLQSEGIISNYKAARGYIKSSSDSDTRRFSVLIDANEDYDSSSDYIPSDSEYKSESESKYDSDSDSDYSPEYYKSYAKKYIQYKNNTQSDIDSDYDSELETDHIKKEIVLKSDTIYDSDSSVEIIENNVNHRVDKLESSVSNMEGMLNKLYNFITRNSSPFTMGYDV
jgi:hypothetical protein